MGSIIGSGLELYIKRDARDTALNCVAEAESRAQEILEQAQQRIEIMQRETSTNTVLRIEQNRRRLFAQADLSAKQLHLDQREQLMRQVWDQVEAHLRTEMAPDKRLNLIANGLSDAARQLEGGALELQVNKEDQALIDDARLADWARELSAMGVTAITMTSEPAAIWGGVLVRRADSRQIVDNSWDERLSLAQRTLRNQVYERLTPASPADSKNQ